MDARARRRRAWLLVVTAVLGLLTVGCTSQTASSGGMTVGRSPAVSGAAAATAGSHPASTSTVPSSASEKSTAASAGLNSSAAPTGAECAAATARAVAAAAALLPAGTSRTPQHADFCSDPQRLDATFPAVGKLKWTVTVKVTAGTAADCQSGAANASARCGPVVGHDGFIAAEAVCSAISCDQAWVFGHRHLAVVLGYVPGSGPGMPHPEIPDFSGVGTAVGVSVLTALQR